MEGIIIASIGAAVSLASVIGIFYKSRGENKNAATNAKNALDARIDERVEEQLKSAWARMDEQDQKIAAMETRETRRTGAFTRILLAIANQWPYSVPGPHLDPHDIAEIEETIPVSWIRKNRPSEQ